jgi:dihydropyrimidinase
MDYDLVIKNGTLVTATNSYPAEIGIRGEKIAAIGQNLSGARELDAGGKYVIPGGVDIHVHMNLALSSGYTSSDTFYTGTKAAAFGGTTAIVEFVEPRPEESLPDALASRRRLADAEVVVDYGLHMTIGPGDIAKLDQIAATYDAGCATFKLYMAYGLRLDDGQLMLALAAIKEAGGLAVVHAENWDVISTLVEKNLSLGRTAPHWHPRSRPPLLEGEAAGRVIDIATYVGAPLHIFHVSCAETADQITAARNRGLPVTGETCPQYLFLTWDAYDAPGVEGALPVCAPPLRAQSDQDALWRALGEGHLQLVSTDHCPFLLAEKERGWKEDFSRIPGGVPGVEMRLSAVYSGGVRQGRLSLNQWVDLCCTTPARVAGFQNKGDLAIGYDADLVIFDPDQKITLSPATLHENVDWTPYQGKEIQGWPAVTISRGEIVVERGEFLGEAGRGRFVARRFRA